MFWFGKNNKTSSANDKAHTKAVPSSMTNTPPGQESENDFSGGEDLSREDLDVLEKATVLESKRYGHSVTEDDLAMPEIHVKRYSKDMEYLETILEEEEEEKEGFIETENLAFPEIHYSKLKKKS